MLTEVRCQKIKRTRSRLARFRPSLPLRRSVPVSFTIWLESTRRTFCGAAADPIALARSGHPLETAILGSVRRSDRTGRVDRDLSIQTLRRAITLARRWSHSARATWSSHRRSTTRVARVRGLFICSMARPAALISTLTGSHAGDNIGSGGVTALSDGNFVVEQPRLDQRYGRRCGRGHVGQRHGRRQRSRQCHQQPGRQYGE